VRTLLAATLVLCGCAGGAPLFHPARTLETGEVRAMAGFSGNVAAAGLADAMRDAKNEAATNPTNPDVLGPPGDETYARGALVAAAVGPGLAPFVGARVGIGQKSEGGVAYTGRGVRIDGRRSFDLSRRWALSIGVGGSAAFYGHQDGSVLPNVDLGQLHGYGADVPLLVGYESSGGLYMIWLGARGGWEHVAIDELRSEPKPVTLGTPPISLSATRFWGGGLVGLAVGFRHVHVALEVDVAYQTVSGAYNTTQTSVSGLTITPGSAVWWRF
jgi:hypothetical protein